jgi:uncharacterized protein YdiU (UPF0061 family)
MTEIQPSTDFRALDLENKYASLPSNFYTCLIPTPLKEPYLVAICEPLVRSIGLDPNIIDSEFCKVFTGNKLIANSQPLAAVYSGHQFGVWAGQLGDGRAILLGDVANSANGSRLEIQLKGSGMTPYSRMGDGRAVLRSSIREFLCSEAMDGLGIPTSRALCITGSDQYVMREEPETTAVVTRLAPSFIRFGSFEHWYYNNRPEELKTLADFVIENYFPELRTFANPYKALLTEVTKRTAELMAYWQSVGFMHGVMNTDNMSILGLTLDYGPFGFMESFDPKHICNHTDQQGRYSYQMQPTIGQWNCHALGQALLPLIGNVDDTQEALHEYKTQYDEKYEQLMHRKLGLFENIAGDRDLIDSLFAVMQENASDFTLTFRQLSHILRDDDSQDSRIRDMFVDRSAIDNWLIIYRARLCREQSDDTRRQQTMLSANPKYVLRNYLAQIAISKAQDKDFSEINKLLQILQHPYDEQLEHESYAGLPPNWASKLEVSCSS